MEKLKTYREIVKQVILDYAKFPYAYGDLHRQTVFDLANDHYLLMTIGWDPKRVHGCLVHIDIIDGKCWIQRDGTEDGMAKDLEAGGIPKSDIVLAFKPVDIRPLTGYAVA